MRIYFLIILSTLCFLSLSSCTGGDGGDGDNGASLEALPLCLTLGTGSLSATKVINGQVCTGSSSPIVRINILNSDGTAGLCSGTVIAPNRVLTAAHCFIVSDVISVSVQTDTQVVNAHNILVHPGVGVDGVNLAVFNDVAVVVTKRNLDSARLPIVVSQNIERGDFIGIEGFGLDENGNFGTQKGGVMKVSKVTENHIFAAYKGKNSNVCNGDSGGPAYLNIADANAPIVGIVGVVSSGNPNTACLDGDVSLFANLQNSEILNFIIEAAPNAELI